MALAQEFEIERTAVEFPSRDVTLTGILDVPKGEREKYPMAILTHGFMGNAGDTDDLGRYLARHGIAALQINLMGSGTSGGRYVDSDFDTQAGDILNALAYVKGLDVTDKNNLFLVGKSQGGFDSALSALKCEDEINGICLWFPAFCIPDDFRAGRVMFRSFDVNDVPECVELFPGFAVGRGMIEQGMAMDIEEVFPKFGKDVLIIHGEDDDVVNVSYAQKMAPLYPRATLTILPGGGHGFRGQNEQDALAYTCAFILNRIAQ